MNKGSQTRKTTNDILCCSHDSKQNRSLADSQKCDLPITLQQYQYVYLFLRSLQTNEKVRSIIECIIILIDHENKPYSDFGRTLLPICNCFRVVHTPNRFAVPPSPSSNGFVCERSILPFDHKGQTPEGSTVRTLARLGHIH